MIIVERGEEMKNIRGDYEIVEDKDIVKVLRENEGEILTEEEFLKRMDGEILNIVVYGDKKIYLWTEEKCDKEEIKKLINIAEASIFYREDKSYSWYITAGKKCEEIRRKINEIFKSRIKEDRNDNN